MSEFNLKQYFGSKKYYQIKYQRKNFSHNQTFLVKQDSDEFLSIKQIVSYYYYFENRQNYLLLMGAIFGGRLSFENFKLLFLQNFLLDRKDSESFAEVFRYSEKDQKILKNLVIDPKIIKFFDQINVFFFGLYLF